jgi:hypothetical protein
MVSQARQSLLVLLIAFLAGCTAQPTPLASYPPSLPSDTPSWAVDSPTSLPSPESTVTPTPRATTRPGEPPQVADPLWVTNESDGNLLLIDPSDNSIAVIVPTNLNPRWVAVGEGFVWALDPTHDALIQVDPKTYAVTRVIPFPDRDVNALAVGAGSVWIAIKERAGLLFLLPQEDYVPQGGVLRLDPKNGEVTGYAQTGPVITLMVQSAPAFLWALGLGPVDTPIIRIDPQTLAFQPITLASTTDSTLVDAFTLTADGFWVFSSTFDKVYYAAPNGRLYGEISLEGQKPLVQAALLPAKGDIWLATPWSSLLRISPGQQRIAAEIPLQHPADHLEYVGGSVWAVSPLGGEVYRIAPASSTVVATISIGQRTQPTPRVSATPIQRAFKPCEDAPFSRLTVGVRAATPREPALPNRVHTEPGKDAEVSGYIVPGQSVLILEGPVCMEGWVWWKVHNEINSVEGWVAEGDELEYWLIPLK